MITYDTKFDYRVFQKSHHKIFKRDICVCVCRVAEGGEMENVKNIKLCKVPQHEHKGRSEESSRRREGIQKLRSFDWTHGLGWD